MISSEGSGMHADSIAISRAMPVYPVALITELMNRKMTARSFSVIGRQWSVASGQWPVTPNRKRACGLTGHWTPVTGHYLQQCIGNLRGKRRLEGAFLSKCI